MTELRANTDAWRRAGADARPPASGEQIAGVASTERAEAADAAPSSAEGRGDPDRPGPEQERPSPNTPESPGDHGSPPAASDTA